MQPGMHFEIRDATLDDAKAIARVHVDSWRATYRGLLPDAVLDGLSYEQREGVWRDRLSSEDRDQFTLVAWDGEDIVGVVSGGRNRSSDSGYAGTVSILYLLPTHQRRGLGRRLMQAAAASLSARGMTSFQVWVHAGNPATRFYEAIGGQYVRSVQFDWASMPWLARPTEPVMVTDREYGWPERASHELARGAQS